MSTTTDNLISPVWTRLTPIMAERAEGAYVYDRDGTRYLDFTSGIGVTNTGHCHPKVVQAIQEQAAKLLHGQANIIFHPPLLELAEELRAIVPQGLDCFFFSNSGAEAVEGAVKLARHATGRPNVIVFQGSFHGRTALTMALTTSKTIYRAAYQPLPAGVFVAPYPYAYRYGWSPEETEAFCLREVEFLLKTQTAPFETAAILVEPVLGEGGYVVPTPGFLAGLRRICDEHGFLLIADEIQSGFGRTGKWFAIQHFGVVPDIMTMAKALTNGAQPMGAVAVKDGIYETIVNSAPEGAIEFFHGYTYSAHPAACAAGLAMMDIFRDERLIDRARDMSPYFLDAIFSLKDLPIVTDIRGVGMMAAVDVALDKAPGARGHEVQKRLYDEGLNLKNTGDALIIAPPFVAEKKHIDEIVDKLRRVLASL